MTFMMAVIAPASLMAWIGNSNQETNGHDSIIERREDRGGGVLPPNTEPKGYSLYDMAKITANFNVSFDAAGNHIGTPPNTPIVMLYANTLNNSVNTFNVKSNTTLYVPIVLSDDGPPVIGNFPDVTKRRKLLNYFYSQQEFGVVYTKIKIDGREISLGSDYVVGVHFNTPLADTAKNYIVSAAFVSPFKKGQHTIETSVKATGAALAPFIPSIFPDGFDFTTIYTINVN
jgi:hypothetical protein